MTATTISEQTPATRLFYSIEHETTTGIKTLYLLDSGDISREDASRLHWMLLNGRDTKHVEQSCQPMSGHDAVAAEQGYTVIDLRYRPVS